MGSVPRYFVGVDLHKTIVQICVLDDAGDIVEEFRLRVVDQVAGDMLLDRITPYLDEGRVAIEAIGMNRWFVNRLLALGVDVVVCDPVKLSLKILGKKTDRHDALEIARRLLLGDIDRNAVTYYALDEEYGIRKVIRARQSLVGMRQQVTNQIRSLLNSYKITGFPGRLTSNRNLSKLAQLEMPTEDLTFVLRTFLAVLTSHAESIASLDQRIEKLSRAAIPQTLQQLPGIGPLTALILVHELGDVRRFKNSRAVAAFAGLVPKVNQSADTAHHGRITKRGNRQVRHVLGEWAVRLLASDKRVADWAQARLKRSHKNKVRMALARRLMIGIYKSLLTGEDFSLERCLA
jgi:transposase